jgi:hypothetical protein
VYDSSSKKKECMTEETSGFNLNANKSECHIHIISAQLHRMISPIFLQSSECTLKTISIRKNEHTFTQCTDLSQEKQLFSNMITALACLLGSFSVSSIGSLATCTAKVEVHSVIILDGGYDRSHEF